MAITLTLGDKLVLVLRNAVVTCTVEALRLRPGTDEGDPSNQPLEELEIELEQHDPGHGISHTDRTD